MKGLGYLFLIIILISCNKNNNGVADKLTPPIIITIKTDSIIEVKGANGKVIILNSIDRVNYKTAFLKEGDTLKSQ